MTNDKKFVCDLCDYETSIKYCFDNHLKSNKHYIKQIGINNQIEKKKQIEKEETNRKIKLEKEENDKKLRLKNEEIEKRNINTCKYCKNYFSTHGSMVRHQSVCIEKNDIVKQLENQIKKMDKKIKKKDQQLEEKNVLYQQLQETLEFERIKKKFHMSASNYLNITYISSPALLGLDNYYIFPGQHQESIDTTFIADQQFMTDDEYFTTNQSQSYNIENNDDVTFLDLIF